MFLVMVKDGVRWKCRVSCEIIFSKSLFLRMFFFHCIGLLFWLIVGTADDGQCQVVWFRFVLSVSCVVVVIFV